jgi:hypothetical protein
VLLGRVGGTQHGGPPGGTGRRNGLAWSACAHSSASYARGGRKGGGSGGARGRARRQRRARGAARARRAAAPVPPHAAQIRGRRPEKKARRGVIAAGRHHIAPGAAWAARRRAPRAGPGARSGRRRAGPQKRCSCRHARAAPRRARARGARGGSALGWAGGPRGAHGGSVCSGSSSARGAHHAQCMPPARPPWARAAGARARGVGVGGVQCCQAGARRSGLAAPVGPGVLESGFKAAGAAAAAGPWGGLGGPWGALGGLGGQAIVIPSFATAVLGRGAFLGRGDALAPPRAARRGGAQRGRARALVRWVGSVSVVGRGHSGRRAPAARARPGRPAGVARPLRGRGAGGAPPARGRLPTPHAAGEGVRRRRGELYTPGGPRAGRGPPA